VPRTYDYVVANHLLSQLDHHDVKKALVNIRDVIKTGGVLRIIDVDVMQGVHAYMAGYEGWFPQDERTGGIDAKFATWCTWYGTRKSVFTPKYMGELIVEAGFRGWAIVSMAATHFGDEEITDLDDRWDESLFIEAVA
jgi:predicted SAM-dependent methyltransferase